MSKSRLPDLPYCPFVVPTHYGWLMTNPYLTDRQRLEILGKALYGKNWKLPTSRVLGCSDATLRGWIGHPVATGPLGNRRWRTDTEPPEEALRYLIKCVRRRIKELEIAIAETRLAPWVDG